MGNCGGMCNAKSDGNDTNTETRVQGWGTSASVEETHKGN